MSERTLWRDGALWNRLIGNGIGGREEIGSGVVDRCLGLLADGWNVALGGFFFQVESVALDETEGVHGTQQSRDVSPLHGRSLTHRSTARAKQLIEMVISVRTCVKLVSLISG